MKSNALKYILTVFIFATVFTACAPDPKPEIVAWPDQERAEAHVELGFNYLQRDNLDVARESFKRALEVDPGSSEAYHGLGLVDAKMLDLDDARANLARSVVLDGDNIAAVSDYAVMLCENESADQGVQLLERNIRQPGQVGASTKLAFGRCYQADGQIQKAIDAYKEVLKLDPNFPQALLSMAHLKFDAQQYLSSSAFLQRYFYTNRISSDALLLAAQVEDLLNNPEERNYYTKQLWSRYPRSDQAIKARKLFSQ